MMKRFYISALLTLFMIMVGTQASAHDIEVANSDGVTIYYKWTNNNTELAVSFRGYYFNSYSNEYTGSVVIPSSVTFNGTTYPVTSIGEYAFLNCSYLTSVTIPSSVTSIGYGAFQGCSGMTSVTVNGGNCRYDSRNNCNAIIETATNTLIIGCMNTIIPNTVTSIGDEAFAGCSGLTSVTIPSSITSIGEYAFDDCDGLTSVTIPSSVTSIGNEAFTECDGLTSVTIPSNVTSIGGGAFSDCYGLNEINFNATNCTSMGNSNNSVFYGCLNLVSLSIGDNVQNIPAYAFYGCRGLTSVTIPSSVTSIGNSAFFGCSGLTSVTIPSSVTTIGDKSFYGCSGLTSVTVRMENPVDIEQHTFTNRTNATLYVPYGCKAAYEAADYWKEFKEIVEMTSQNSIITFADANVKALCVGNWDTNGDGELDESEAAAVTDLGAVFQSNSSIKTFNELQYFTGLTSIGNSAFRGCSGLTSVTIPSSVTSIGNFAFSNCSGLTSVNIPPSVKSIGSSAFQDCSGLTSVSIPSSVSRIGYGTFWGCSGLTSVTIPSSVISIGESAFVRCSGLTSVSIPSSVESIGEGAFSSCSGMTSVIIPSSVTSIGENAFSNCWGLTSISVASHNDKYDSRNNCNAIIETETNAMIAGCKNTIIPNTVTSIGSAFYGCSSLTSVNIPSSVTSIGNAAFYNCI